jgi:hypothetical protein
MSQQISRKGVGNICDPVWYAIIEAIAGSKLSESDNLKLGGKRGDEFITVEFVVNGVELNFEAALQQFNEQFSRMVNEKAEELIREKFDDSLDKLRDTVDDAADALRKDLEEKFNITIATDEDD